jgi:hypothetical protein
VALTITDAWGQICDATLGVNSYSAPTVTLAGPTNGKLATDYTYTATVTGGKAPYIYNWTGNYYKAFTSSGTWTVPAGVTSVKVLVVGGGGGGGGSTAGGGGGGGVIYNSNYPVTPGVITVTVGDGGLGSRISTQGVANNTNGGNSVFGTLMAIGGGYGFSGYTTNSRVASNGGSGGGAGYFSGNDILISSPGSGTAGQGYAGGTVAANDNWGGAGGGGAGGAGSPNTNPSSTRNGGTGVQNDISGTSKYYGGGGGGGVYLTDAVSPGGLGGGGNGGSGDPTIPQTGVANTGGGGGGGGYHQYGPGGGAGGSGVVIIQYSICTASSLTTQWLTPGPQTVALTITDALGQTANNTLDVTAYQAQYFPLATDAKDEAKLISPSTEINTAYENGAVWVGQATTNMLSNVTNSFNYWGTLTTGVSEYFTAPNGHQGVHLSVTACNGGVNWYNSGVQVTALASTVYTVSAIIKYTGAPSINLFYLRQYRTDGSQITEGGQYNSSYQTYLGNGWYKAYATFTTASDCVKFLIHGYEYYVNETWIYDLQCEQGSYYTPFVSGIRGVSALYLPIVKAQNTNFSISIEMFGKSSHPDIFCDDADRWNGQLRSNASTGIELLVRANGRGATANLYGTLPITSVNRWNRYTLVSIAGYGTKIYQNAKLVLDAPNYYTQYNALSVGRNGMGDANVYSAMFRNLLITDTALTQLQIADLCNTQP